MKRKPTLKIVPAALPSVAGEIDLSKIDTSKMEVTPVGGGLVHIVVGDKDPNCRVCQRIADGEDPVKVIQQEEKFQKTLAKAKKPKGGLAKLVRESEVMVRKATKKLTAMGPVAVEFTERPKSKKGEQDA